MRLRAPTLLVREESHKSSVVQGDFLVLLCVRQRGLAQLVARTAGGREVIGSNPVTPTRLKF